MRLVLTIFWIILAFFILWVFSLNVGQAVNVDLFFANFEKVDLITVTFSSLFVGFSFGIIFFLIQFAKSKKEAFQMKRQISALQTELDNLRKTDQETTDAISPPSEEQATEEPTPDKSDS